MENTNQFLGTERVGKLMRRYAVPCIISLLVGALYNIVDQIFIANASYLGSYGNAANTVVFPLTVVALAIAVMIGDGCCAFVSISLGKGEVGEARKSVGSAVVLSIASSLVLTALYLIFADAIISMFGGTVNEETFHYAQEYFFYISLGIPFYMFGQAMNPVIRADGDPRFAMISTLAGAVLNIILDPIFIFECKWGMMGAAIATALSNVIALVYFLVVVLREGKRSILRLSPLRLGKSLRSRIPADVLTTGLPACLMTLCENVSYAVLDALMAVSGTALQAGLGVAKKVNMLAHSIVRGMSQGVLPLIGYNYASGDHKRMKASITLSMALSIAMAALCMTVSLVFSRQLIGLFIPGGSESVTYGAAFLRILCLGGPFSACAYALISFFQAVGKGMRSFLLAILRKGLLDIPLMFLLNRLLPIFGVVWATPITDVICCCISIAMFVAFLRGQEGLLDDKPATAEPVRRRWMKLAHS